MLHLSSVDGKAALPLIERMPLEDRESIRIAYVPLAPALQDRRNLCNVTESRQVLSPIEAWGSIKIGAGTPPVRVSLGGTEGLALVFSRRGQGWGIEEQAENCDIARASSSTISSGRILFCIVRRNR